MNLTINQERILLVEDNEEIRLIMGEFLESSGYEVFLAENGKKALDWLLLQKGELKCLVTDFNMPEMNGRELIESVISMNLKVRKVIVCSTSLEKEKFLHSLGDHKLQISFLEKPFYYEELLKELALLR